jgi:outer membrane protein OmpA-like peptidoglycan-associated protein
MAGADPIFMITKRMFRLLMISAALSPLAAVPAAAQLYPGQDVIVNPAAIPPAQSFGPGEYGRIVLKPPHRHPRHPAVAKTAALPDTPTTTADATPPPSPPPEASTPAPPPPKRKHQAAAPAQQAADSPTSADGVPFSMGEDEPLGAAAPTTKVAKAEAPPVQAAKSDKKGTPQATAAALNSIPFEPNSTEPKVSAEGVKLLADDLNTALSSGATQIQLQAFAGTPGDKSSDARRIALKRALAIRQLLIDDGVPAARIVTRAMGGITDAGIHDRVDIFVLGG